jgi:hypothetical protein
MENAINDISQKQSSTSVADSIAADSLCDQQSSQFTDVFSSGSEDHFDSFRPMLGNDQGQAFNDVSNGFANSLQNDTIEGGAASTAMENQTAQVNTTGSHDISYGLRSLITDQVDQLNTDGDSAVFQLRAEVSAKVLGGIKGQYGYRVEVTQSGGKLPEGMTGERTEPEYQITFDKRLMAGITGEIPIPILEPEAEYALRSADTVTMTFDTKEDAAQAVDLLGRIAASETVKDTLNSTSPISAAISASDLPQNPLAEDDDSFLSGVNSLFSNPIANLAGDLIAPNDEEMAFLTDHISGYSSHVDLRERHKLGAEANLGIGDLGVELRNDNIAGVTRTVALPRDGEPGSVTYSFELEKKISSKDGGAVGIQVPSTMEIGLGLRDRLEHGSISGEISLTWEYGANEMGPTISGTPYPEIDSILDGSFEGPDNATVSLQADIQDQAILDPTRTDMANSGVKLSIDQPGQTSGDAINAMLSGDISGAMDAMGENAQLAFVSQNTDRSGFDLQPELEIGGADVVGVKAALIAEMGVNDITQRNEWLYGGKQAEEVGNEPPTENTSDESQTDSTADEGQVVVAPREGLTLRDAPGGERQSVFYHGTFLDPTGQTQTDANGLEWVEVGGLDVNDNMVTGWIDSQYVNDHPKGAMNDEGRINPDLENQGYRAYRVEAGDNIWDIAHAQGVDFEETVALNADHLIDPSLIFEGDVVYLPVIDEPAAPSNPSGTTTSESDRASNSTDPMPTEASITTAPSNSSSTSSSDTNSTVADPTDPVAPVTDPARRTTKEILSEYQVAEDEMVEYHPGLGPLTFIRSPFHSHSMTETEAGLLDQLGTQRGISGLLKFNDIKETAYDTADERFPGQGREDGHNDAFRHTYWNALMTSHFGEGFAASFGTAHEGVEGNPADREAMDLFNNELGRRIATDHPDASDEELADLVFNAIDRGEAMVIDANGELAYSDRVDPGRTGLADDPSQNGGIQPPVWTNSAN